MYLNNLCFLLLTRHFVLGQPGLERSINASHPILTHFGSLSTSIANPSIIRIPFEQNLDVWTIELFVKPMGGTDTQQAPLSFKSFPSSGREAGFWIERHKTEWRCKTASSIDSSTEVLSTVAVVDNQWTHIVCQLDAAKYLTLHINGVSEAVPNADFAPNTDQPLTLGADVDSNQTLTRFFNGEIRTVALYDVNLNETEIGKHVAAALKESSSVTNSDVLSLKNSVSSAQAQISEQNILLTTLDIVASNVVTDIASLNDSQMAIQTDVSLFSEKLEIQSGKSDALFNSIASQDTKITELQQTSKSNSDLLTDVQKNINTVSSSLDSKSKDIQSKLKANSDSITGVKSLVDQNVQTISSHSSDMENLTANTTNTKNELDQLTSTNTQQFADIEARIEDITKNITDKIENSNSDLESLARDVGSYIKNILEHETQIANLTKMFQDFEAKLNKDCFLRPDEISNSTEGNVTDAGMISSGSSKNLESSAGICSRPDVVAETTGTNFLLIGLIVGPIIILFVVAAMCYHVGKKRGMNLPPVRLDTREYDEMESEKDDSEKEDELTL